MGQNKQDDWGNGKSNFDFPAFFIAQDNLKKSFS